MSRKGVDNRDGLVFNNDMSNTATDTKTGKTYNVISVTELGPATRRNTPFTHTLVLQLPAGRKYLTSFATIEDDKIVRMSAPIRAPW
jgi:hypothetical protein